MNVNAADDSYLALPMLEIGFVPIAFAGTSTRPAPAHA
jgi:hypothetical protein